ncbi:hypothetical protein F2P56_030273 [Juglans regia]|uniref:Single-stranded DNA binding protein Ssb-like OB fold domain-containing protein n=1 Tax=Juglans regia TaxID=51240 RepID=A0A833TKU3_JUGRE|nr:hypothetical protein F2P56_030273 [Juglans regia]
MAESKPGLRKPVFTKVDQLRPGTSGHTLIGKVVSTKMVLQKGRADGPQVRQMRIAECLVGDETGMIIFTARNDQVDLMKEGTTVILRNAKIDIKNPQVEENNCLSICTLPFAGVSGLVVQTEDHKEVDVLHYMFAETIGPLEIPTFFVFVYVGLLAYNALQASERTTHMADNQII